MEQEMQSRTIEDAYKETLNSWNYYYIVRIDHLGREGTNSNFGRLSNPKVANLRGIGEAASFVDVADGVNKALKRPPW